MQLVLLMLLGALGLGLYSKRLSAKSYIVLGLLVLFAVIGFLFLSDQFL